MDKFFYPNFSDNWDDKLFREYILKEITTDTILLDIGAGAGILSEMNFRGLVKKVYGIDPDPRVLENKNLDEGTLGTGDSIPFDNGFFDVIICDNVLEHVTNPQRFFRESYRVLKSKGIFLTKTPNRYHYVPIIAMFTPTWLHKFINSLRGRQEEDTFPTVYKVNHYCPK
jgi:2-polyprenyl-3-methyl-5-hydroxy-6-metoxy-1,4-benzoquinol methylase